MARPNAILPGTYEHDGTKIIYPKDVKANGSWIAFTQTGNAAVLLNGAFAKHIAKPPYRKSRGVVFIDIISNAQPEFCFLGMNLEMIEPFTLVLFVNSFLFEGRWDGEQKYFVQLNEKENYIWSSATLYTPEIINKRKQWFDKWLAENPNLSSTDVFNFHRFAGDGDTANSILMNRNEMLTISITGIEINMNAATMQHFDLKENKHALKLLQLETIPA
jgi:hypothetical protein